MQDVDAIVIGSGPNGLMAANRLADAGWQVLVLEAQPRPGGAVASDREVHPDFVHDTFSSFYPLAAASDALSRLKLEEHGLVWCHAPAVVGTPRADGSWALLDRDAAVTAEWLDAAHPGDGETWHAMVKSWRAIRPALIRSLLTPFPPLRGAVGMAARLPRAGGLPFLKMLVEPATTMAATRFHGDGPSLLIAGNAAHADLPVNGAGSGLFGWLLTMLGQDDGFPVPQGGAGELTAAMVRRFQAAGGELRCDSEVTSIDVVDGRAVGVRLAGGDQIRARRAVLADVAAPALYGGLVPAESLPTRTRTAIRRFQWDPSTVKVDFALSGPIPWAGTPAKAPGTVQIFDSVSDMTMWAAQLEAGYIPADPLLLLGQMTTTDPTRSAAGTESVWAYTHVPQQVRGDAGDGSITGSWDSSDSERMADRLQARIEQRAPGFGSRIIARRMLTPLDLERRNANLVGGAIGGGTSAVHQQLVFRPVPGLGRAETPIASLYLASSSAHPGGGVHGACGANAARAALLHDRIRSPLRIRARRRA
jgi:phytoene dehydrogenase-like protein